MLLLTRWLFQFVVVGGSVWLTLMCDGFSFLSITAPPIRTTFGTTTFGTTRTTRTTTMVRTPTPTTPPTTISRSSFLSIALAAASQEEDLELTRQIILNFLSGTTTTTTQSSKGQNDDDDDNVNKDDKDDNMENQEEIQSSSSSSDYPLNDLMIRAAWGEPVEKTPIWLFRQAGRHLPEYQAYKKEKNMNFLELLAHPETVAECTMQPIRRYEVDAAILFSDILVVPQALGINVTMPGGVGIQVPYPLLSPMEIQTRLPTMDDITPEFVQDKLGHVILSVQEIRKQMTKEGKSIPLIGFSAAPWTLLFYMVGGSSKKNTNAGIQWMKQYPDSTHELLQLLTKIVIEYMAAQIDAGVHILQVFEAMGMMIGTNDNFRIFAMPYLQQIAQELKIRYPTIPLMIFARGACQMNSELATLGYYDVITLDGNSDRFTARKEVMVQQPLSSSEDDNDDNDDDDTDDGRHNRRQYPITLQGNYNPAELIPDNSSSNKKTVETVRATAKQLLMELGTQQLIVNLGEGLSGKESPILVEAFVNAIHEESAIMIAADLASGTTTTSTSTTTTQEQQEQNG